MKVSVEVFGRLKDFSDDNLNEDLKDGATLFDLIVQISEKNNELKNILLNESGKIYNNIIIQLNKKRIMPKNAEKTILNEGDEIKIYPAVSGG